MNVYKRPDIYESASLEEVHTDIRESFCFRENVKVKMFRYMYPYKIFGLSIRIKHPDKIFG